MWCGSGAQTLREGRYEVPLSCSNFREDLQCEVRPGPRSVGMPHEGFILLAGGFIGFLCKALAGSWSWRTQETQRHRTGPMQIEKPSACPRRGDEGRTA